MTAGKIKIYDIVLIALMTAVTVVCSLICIPFGAVPVTLQTFAVCVCSGLLGWKKGTLCVLLYLLLGVVGLPVFSGFQGGAGVLLGATGGFALGFVPMSLVAGVISEKSERKTAALFAAYFSGTAVCYVVGALWYAFVYSGGSIGVADALTVCIAPFIIPDAVKIVLAVFVTRRVYEQKKRYMK